MIGRTIGNYRILEKLGEGGMGSVYRATDLMLERDAAIKVLRPDLAGEPEIVERFRSEAVTLARLQHPHIATLYSLTREAGELMMVMEFVRGDTLERILERSGAIAPGTAVNWGCQVLEAMEYAHRKGVVHRDIKPANVMITDEGEVKVTDFGIARVLGESRKTRTGHIIGTIAYMAPEQIRGQDVDARTDLYALGILLFELLTGRLPFQAETDFTLMMAQVNQPPPPARSLSAAVPEWLDESIQRALAKTPADRFQTAREFKAVLQSGLRLTPLPQEARPVLPEPPTVLMPAGGFRVASAAGRPRVPSDAAAAGPEPPPAAKPPSPVTPSPATPPPMPPSLDATPPAAPPFVAPPSVASHSVAPPSVAPPYVAAPTAPPSRVPQAGDLYGPPLQVEPAAGAHLTAPAEADALPSLSEPEEAVLPPDVPRLTWRFYAVATVLALLTAVAGWFWLGPALASWRHATPGPAATATPTPSPQGRAGAVPAAENAGAPGAIGAAGHGASGAAPPGTVQPSGSGVSAPAAPANSPVPPAAAPGKPVATPAPTPKGPVATPGLSTIPRGNSALPPAELRPGGTVIVSALPPQPNEATPSSRGTTAAPTPTAPTVPPATATAVPSPPVQPPEAPPATAAKPADAAPKPADAAPKPVAAGRADATFTDVVWTTSDAAGEAVEADAVLEFQAGAFVIKPDDTEIASRTVGYATITSLTYTQNKPSKWGRLLLRRTSHWLSLNSRNGDLLLQLDGGNYKNIIAELEARTGLKAAIK